MKKWITFDLDATLIKNPFSEWVFPEIESIVSTKNSSSLNILKKLREEHKRRLDDRDFYGAYDWDNIVNQVLKSHGITSNIDVEMLVNKHAVHPKVYLLEKDIKFVLDQLQRQGFSLAVITNGFYKYQYPVLKALGLTALFDRIITPTETGVGKPEENMAKGLFKEGEMIAHVGDRLDHDVYFSNRIGALSILIDRKMPEKVREFLPDKRPGQTYYLEKWQEINAEKTNKNDKTNIPKVIVYSIKELASFPFS